MSEYNLKQVITLTSGFCNYTIVAFLRYLEEQANLALILQASWWLSLRSIFLNNSFIQIFIGLSVFCLSLLRNLSEVVTYCTLLLGVLCLTPNVLVW